MKAYIWRHEGKPTNFGDELNEYLWSRLLPGFFDQKEDAVFFGVGTILQKKFFDSYPPETRFIIFGSGVGYMTPPEVTDHWETYFVRGPLTAEVLDLPKKLAITDPGILVRDIISEKREKAYEFSFMPHWQYNSPDMWGKACECQGIKLIDPRKPVDQVIEDISRTEILVTETLHGAVVADSLRIPWIPVMTNPNILKFKWDDWCKTIKVGYDPYVLPDLRITKYKFPRAKQIEVKVRRMLQVRGEYSKAGEELKSLANAVDPVLSKEDTVKKLHAKVIFQLEKLRRDHEND
ncbi:MAG: polysaccharide pyruvyl transferase family protein [Methanobacteriota archaeon]